tara:strand:- start:488 stop:619 length:132 start_codon:yes stop_codon:yes gene_type:complete
LKNLEAIEKKLELHDANLVALRIQIEALVKLFEARIKREREKN